MAARSRERAGGVDRILSKLQSNIEAGNYYEAHQMYRTIYFRYLSQKNYKELLDLLYEGSCTLLKLHQHNSGADLASLVVDVLIKAGSIVTSEDIDKLARLFSLMLPESPERFKFLTGALKWSSQGEDSHRRGHPYLHQHIALILWKEKNYAQSRYHFIHSSDGDGCASMLVEYHVNKGYPSEADLFITQAVLQFLCLKNKSTASVVFYSYTEKHPSVHQGPPYLLPLLNFVWFLLLAVESGKLAVFNVLCEKYQPSISRDPTYPEYLSKIGQIFFGLPPPPPKQQGFLNQQCSLKAVVKILQL
ncbi:Golgi to ER traffic protein 4 homolog isoform X2 [Tachypleus tridentatus]|uniref:Golgi to ER traffic protein 4 homolog isoform X2 n=1 Tax=Tachypleus tridentatus TaxID=6853 RepID=UPI003FD1C362